MKVWQPQQRSAIPLGAPYHFIRAHTCRYACMHGCPQAQRWLSPTPWLCIWMSELFNGGRQRRGQPEHLGRPPWGEWVCSSVGRLTHFIISLSNTPSVQCMHERAKAIVKQAHVRTRHGATGSETWGHCAIFTLISVLDKNACIKLILHLQECAFCFVVFFYANVGVQRIGYQGNRVNLKHLSKKWISRMVDNSLFRVLLSAMVSKDSSLRPITEAALLMILSNPSVSPSLTLLSQHKSRVGNVAGDHRLGEDLQHFVGSQFPPGTRVCSPALVTLLGNQTFSLGWFCSVHSPNVAYHGVLYPPSSHSPRHLTKAESSENFCRWRGSELLRQSVVYKVKWTGESTVPREAPLTTASDRTPGRMDRLRPACQGVTNPGDHWGTEKLQLLTQWQRLTCIKSAADIREWDPHSATSANHVHSKARPQHHRLPNGAEREIAKRLLTYLLFFFSLPRKSGCNREINSHVEWLWYAYISLLAAAVHQGLSLNCNTSIPPWKPCNLFIHPAAEVARGVKASTDASSQACEAPSLLLRSPLKNRRHQFYDLYLISMYILF